MTCRQTQREAEQQEEAETAERFKRIKTKLEERKLN
jgi:hypothetical protein